MATNVESPGDQYTVIRWLETEGNQTTGRMALTIAYLVMIALCFAVPFCYYARMYFDERRERLQRGSERANGGEAQGEENEEGRQARRKLYREFKRAQILEMFSLVRVTLSEKHFPHLSHSIEESKSTAEVLRSDVEMGLNRKGSSDTEPSSNAPSEIEDTIQHDIHDIELGESLPTLVEVGDGSGNDTKAMEVYDDDIFADETTFIEIPSQGLPSLDAPLEDKRKRLVPSLCAICLANYEVGDDVVWSSNSECEHAFHEQCIEKWLMRKRGYPLCPCCRRDFVVDPYDLDDESIQLAMRFSDHHAEDESPPVIAGSAPEASPTQNL